MKLSLQSGGCFPAAASVTLWHSTLCASGVARARARRRALGHARIMLPKDKTTDVGVALRGLGRVSPARSPILPFGAGEAVVGRARRRGREQLGSRPLKLLGGHSARRHVELLARWRSPMLHYARAAPVEPAGS